MRQSVYFKNINIPKYSINIPKVYPNIVNIYIKYAKYITYKAYMQKYANMGANRIMKIELSDWNHTEYNVIQLSSR